MNSPSGPKQMDWIQLYPTLFNTSSTTNASTRKVEFADVGCGFGGLLVALGPRFPGKLMLGKMRAAILRSDIV